MSRPTEEWGWSPEWEERLAEVAAGRRVTEAETMGAGERFRAGRPARVTSRARTLWTLQTDEGPRQGRTPSAGLPEGVPAVGDWVIAEPGDTDDAPWTIDAILPRRSKFSRKVAGQKEEEQIVAANVDRVWILHGLDLPPNPRRLERFLAVAWESGAQPEIVLTKADIAVSLQEAKDTIEGVAFDVPIHVVSTKGAPGTGELEVALRSGETIALLGPSGVGKSSLVNHLAGVQVMDEAEVRAGDRKGRHTTTHRQLVRLPGGAMLLDTPGMRELQVWDLGEGLGAAFPEIDALAAGCRFRDCRHLAEPGCAVRAAVESGDLPEERLESYRKLEAEAERR